MRVRSHANTESSRGVAIKYLIRLRGVIIYSSETTGIRRKNPINRKQLSEDITYVQPVRPTQRRDHLIR
jgi:hypothetical protein